MTRIQVETGSVTRGYGLLEAYLARQRANIADRLVPASLRHGRILDIGCGGEPYFLPRTEFAEKIGVDKVVDEPTANARHASIRLMHFDINASNHLPFPSESISVVTMLAVFEHVRVDRLIALINEIERLLRPGGAYIVTTPAGWTAPILTLMKWLRLVSPVEIDEHQDAYSRAKIRYVLQHSRFAGGPIYFGSFELLMNTWMVVTKSESPPSV